MIKALDKQWDSTMALYIARRLQEIAGGQRIAVLDVGCGAGGMLEYLLGYGYDLYGYDLVALKDEWHKTRRKKLAPYFGASYDEHIKVTRSEREIPFEDNFFDVVYANQVFEHVRFLDKMISECARVLRPGGIFLTTFPLATSPVEGHVKVPFAHWIPPGKLRVRYLQSCLALGLHGALAEKKDSGLETAIFQDRYLREETYYRFMNEAVSVSKYYFEACTIETEALIRAKIDLLTANDKTSKAWLGSLLQFVDGDKLRWLVTNFYNAAFCMSNPRKDVNLQPSE